MISIVLLAATTVAALLIFSALRPPLWKDDWAAPPGFAEMLADFSAGRASDGEARMKTIFGRHRSPLWRQRADLALGVARLRRREYDAASKALRKASRGGPVLSFTSLKRAEALLGAGRFREAEGILREARGRADDPVLADDLAIASARALAAQGLNERARQELASYLSSKDCREKGRVLEAATALAETSGDRGEAIELARRLYLEEPRSREAAAALDRLTALATPPLRFTTRDLPKVAARARTLIDAEDGKAALATWDLVLASVPTASSDPRWRLEIAEAAVEAKQPGRALALLRTTARPGNAHRAWLLGRALFGVGRDREAIASLRVAASGDGPHAEDALFRLATSLDQTDRDGEGLERFLEYIRRFKDGDRMDGALWRAGWLSYRLGKRDQAHGLFQKLLARSGAAAYHPSAIYWIGRAQEARKRTASAIASYRQIVSRWSRDYYGLLASRRLSALGAAAAPKAALSTPPARASAGEIGSLGHPPRDFCERSGGSPADFRVGAGCELETIGFFLDAQKQYEAALSPSPDRAVLLRLSEIALKRGDRGAAISRLKAAVPDYLGAPIETLPRRFWEVLYPRSEWETLAAAARARRLDPSLICGLILQESGFNPLAVSQAGAVGLMQVLPGTGSDAARALGETRFRPSRLLEPAMNIRVGTWHFSQLLARQGGALEIALAAYNAGEARVRHWRSVFGTNEPTFFVEEVPYTETRLYVKRVLSHAAMYRAIYGP